MNKDLHLDNHQAYDDEIDLKDIIIPLWKAKCRILLFGLITATFVLIYLLSGVALDKSRYVSLQVLFNFQGVETGRYPSGETFSPQELLSSAVLSEVYSNLDSPDFSYDTLVSALHLIPNFNGAKELELVVSALVSKDKGLTNSEYRAALSGFTEQLNSQSKKNIILTMDMNLFNGNLKKSSDVLFSIPRIWAEHAIEDRGVLNISSPPVTVLNHRLKEDGLLIQVNVLSDTYDLLSTRVNSLFDTVQTQSISDPVSGMSITDLRYKLNVEHKYRISILKELVVKNGVGVQDVIWFKGFRDARLDKLKRDKSSLDRMVNVYEQALTEFNRQASSSKGGDELSNGNNSGTSVYAPQFDEDVINQLLALGSKISDSEYRKTLLQEKINISKQLQKLITEIDFYSYASRSSEAPNIPVKEISNLIEQSFKELQEIHAVLVGIVNVANLSYLNNKGELFDFVGTIEEKESSNLSPKVMLQVALAFILGCMIGVVVVFTRRALRE